MNINPINITSRTIANTFWGKAWCRHIESFSDFANRLPRGRSYVRNGSVCHLEITPGQVSALVSGNQLYTVTITVNPLPHKKWEALKTRCSGQIGSLIELLEGRLSQNVMTVVTDPKKGLFPLVRQIGFACSCPDWAVMCKHVAAALYGVGARLDEEPELIFLLRGVDRDELISTEADFIGNGERKTSRRRMSEDSVSDVFGIDVAADTDPKLIPETADLNTPRNNITGTAVIKLRKKFSMNKSEFARLLGVSAATVGTWERKTGKINLQARTGKAWQKAVKMTKSQARQTAGL